MQRYCSNHANVFNSSEAYRHLLSYFFRNLLWGVFSKADRTSITTKSKPSVASRQDGDADRRRTEIPAILQCRTEQYCTEHCGWEESGEPLSMSFVCPDDFSGVFIHTSSHSLDLICGHTKKKEANLTWILSCTSANEHHWAFLFFCSHT